LVDQRVYNTVSSARFITPHRVYITPRHLFSPRCFLAASIKTRREHACAEQDKKTVNLSHIVDDHAVTTRWLRSLYILQLDLDLSSSCSVFALVEVPDKDCPVSQITFGLFLIYQKVQGCGYF